MDAKTSLANFIADIIEARGEHWADGGFSACLDQKGFTEAGRRRLVEELRAPPREPRQAEDAQP